MPEEEYELMPHRAVARIKRELELLKKNAGKQPSVKMKQSMDKLNDNINSLRNLFQEAAKAMPEEGPDDSMKPLFDRMDKLEEENRQIAQGILVVADLVKELKGEAPKPAPKPMPLMPKPVFRQMPPKPPQMHEEPPKMAPLPEAPPGMAPLPEPPGMGGMRPMPPRETPLGPPPMPPPPKPDFVPMGKPIPPPMPPGVGMPMHGPSELPPLPDLKAGPKKKGFFAKLFKK